MLITPMRPNTTARPSAISRRMEASDAPWKSVSTVRVRRPQRSIRRMACPAASRAAGEGLGLAGARARVDAALAERVEELEPPRIASLSQDGDGGLALVGVFTCEVGERAGDLGRRGGQSRVARRSRGEPRDH